MEDRGRRHQDLQLRVQDSDSLEDDDNFLRANPRFDREEYHNRGGVCTDFQMKIDLHPFNGKMDVENFFDYTNTPKAKKVRMVAFKL